MNNTYNIVLLIAVFNLAGCAPIKHDYVWKEYPVTSDRITTQTNFKEGVQIKITSGKSDDSIKLLGIVGKHQYFGSEQSLTDGIVEQLTKEMRKLEFEITDETKKSLEITVIRSSFESRTWVIVAIIEFTVKFGNGKIKPYSMRNASPASTDRAYNGVVALAVLKILNDPEILNYIND